MSEHMKRHPISAHANVSTMLHVTYQNKIYAIPKTVIEKFVVKGKNKIKKEKNMSAVETIFNKLDDKFTKAGALLKGLRAREGLSQVEFAKKIDVTQSNLSSMENGRRPIGKVIAKRIEKIFGTNYRYFLG